MITAWALQAGQKLSDSRLSRRAILCWYGVPQGKGEQWTLKFETKAPPAHNDVQGCDGRCTALQSQMTGNRSKI